jgi:rfaE bifunctional protein kinase chain/domain
MNMSLTTARFEQITRGYPALRIAVLGDFCLDRYLEIDPARAEVSIETGLPVYNVVRVRAQPGAAGTILNNLIALGIGALHPIGFCGEDGEGYELRRALGAGAGVQMNHFWQTPERRTFTYCKPLRLEAGRAPVELSRLDSKNWSPTPAAVEAQLSRSLHALAADLDALIVLDQVDVADTGVVTRQVLGAVAEIARARPDLLILADSRRGLSGFPPVGYKMNRHELAKLLDAPAPASVDEVGRLAAALARRQQQPVFVTLSEDGMLAASAAGEVVHVPALPIRGEIDIVGAGDAVTANLAAGLAAGATLPEACELAMGAASVVVHQLGTTGTASVAQIRARRFG